jgi:hypothetical protein
MHDHAFGTFIKFNHNEISLELFYCLLTDGKNIILINQIRHYFLRCTDVS